ncbi:MAG TPA: hypothetical protein VF941_19740 [Clostridia bacterium]
MPRKIIFIALSVLLLVLNSCSSNNTLKDIKSSKPEYEIYAAGENGVIKYVQIYNLKDLKYKTPSSINLREIGMYMDDMVAAPINKVYCSIYRTSDGSLGKNLCVLKDGEIEKNVKLNSSVGPNSMISDVEKGKAYVLMAVQPASYNPDGNVYNIVDSNNDSWIKPFYMKGYFWGYDIKDNLIYTVVTSEGLGFQDTPASYIASIDRETQKINILTKSGMKDSGTDIKISPNNDIDILSGDKIQIYKADGTFVKEIPLGLKCNKMVINKKGIAYICNDRNNNEPYSGSCVLIFDTNTGKITGKIEGFDGCSSLCEKDGFLFVGNHNTGDVSIIDTSTNKKTGDIHLGDIPITKLVVCKV